ncbi:hypothetical protein FHS27_001282 [Rhodopirellula rubra]|uniref:site-specific DNA-methyltransferase (adenine-specific) n=1 Tax=Aporhodopirellula rubra TaxID=980271 RepID=A0A7W5DWI8_9BACT|nr:type IIL restriction-modification enzyme MmeI [Aporhodopirellula rubra]MBB3205482.1 hypothetical protein [Aporhodopirellula rubra]
MAKSPEELAHIEWLGYVQPIGLVVSIPAMLEAQCYVNKNIMGEHARFLECLAQDDAGVTRTELRDLREFVQAVLGWEAEDLVDVPARQVLGGDMGRLEVVLPQYNETLRPTHAVPVFRPEEDQNPWQLLIQELSTGTDLDDAGEADSSRHWNASPQAKFERLLRETEVPIGLLSNGRSLRLVYSPRGETSGYATFNVDEMAQVAGRPMFAALHMLLSAERMFSMGDNQRLPAILANSRKYQNTVSTELAEQVLAALYELMRGFQAANDVRGGELLSGVLARDPNQVYSGLLTVLMRLVFILYAEDRDLLSSDPVYSNHYSVTGLFDRLREDDGRFPDTMDQRFGAWSQLVTLFRLVYEGGQHSEFKLPARKGYLFDPDRYPFLEGRSGIGFQPVDTDDRQDAHPTVPRVSDGVVFRVLKNLLILDGERLSYRTLDVEQIGSVYETVMGFNLQVAAGKSIAIKPVKSHGAPATINLDELLETPGKDRAKWLKENADQKVGTADAKLLKAATNLEELLTALDKKIAKKVTPRVVPAGAIVLQPSDERRRSGSHYTPRSLTEPIVRTTLEPILAQLVGGNPTTRENTSPKRKREDQPDDTGDSHSLARRACKTDELEIESPLPAVYSPSKEDKKRYTQGELDARVRLSQKAVEHARRAREVGTPHPSQILDLKVCDPAMGSGAFLVETCRQLGDELIKSWYAHDAVPSDIPPDEDEVLYARRLVAQRCLYGVDKNFMAVDLAKLALWLVTLARDHAFTFLDHALRHGDSLVGLSREQIIGFHWEPKKQKKFGEDLIQRRLDRATEARAKILNAREDVAYRDQEQKMALAEEALSGIRLLGDACVSAFFAGKKKKEREDRVDQLFGIASAHLEKLKEGKLDHELRKSLETAAKSLQEGEHPIPAFHWEIEFPEVFSRENGGFDAFVGNPPFLGGTRISSEVGMEYFQWLVDRFPPAGHHCDQVAYFFRNCYERLRSLGTFGLIATKTVSQGDTREGGLVPILKAGGVIYSATKQYRWPGAAAVMVAIVHTAKDSFPQSPLLEGAIVNRINAYLLNGDMDESPVRLASNPDFSLGCKIYGQGFLFAEDDADCTPLSKVGEIIEQNPSAADRIKPYIGGDEVNSTPTHEPRRSAIYFSDIAEEEGLSNFPHLREIVATKVKPGRDSLGSNPNNVPLKKRWWAYQAHRPDFYRQIAEMQRVLVIPRVTQHMGFTFLDVGMVHSEQLVLFAIESNWQFAILQSRIHEVWARFFSSSLEDRLRYTASDCFQTFPFPRDGEIALSTSGQKYFQLRRNVMISNDEGLTKTYNRFHSPDERDPGILELRELHDEMDRDVLRAYGWDDLAETARCEFLLDYEEEEDDQPGAKKSKKKKPWRLRWPDDFRDEVLARLLELNEQRHKEELLLAKQKKEEAKAPKKGKDELPMPLLDDQMASDDDQAALTDDDRMTLAILAAWGEGTLVDRVLFGESIVLWRNDKHRRFRGYLSEDRQKRLKPAVSMKKIVGRAVRKGWLTQTARGEIEFLKLIMQPSPLGELTDGESEKLDQIRDIVQREKEAENSVIEVTEDSIRASAPFAVARPAS